MTSIERTGQILYPAGYSDIRAIFAAGLAAAEPSQAVQRAMRREGGSLVVEETVISIGHGVHVVAVGKAAVAMTHGAVRALGDAIVSGDVITKDGHARQELPSIFRVRESGHPIPDERGVRATISAVQALEQLPNGAVVVALISGGGSALLEAPVDGVELSELALMTDLLLRAGAPIHALNAARAPLSRVKSGGLRQRAAGADWVTLILSDVLSNDPRVIASGPTLVSQADPARALAVLEQFEVIDEVPLSILRALNRAVGAAEVGVSGRNILLIVGDNGSAVSAAAEFAETQGHNAKIVWRAVEGEAAELGRAWVDVAAHASESADVLLGGGEATVTVRGSGLGGRNTEFALAAAMELERRSMNDWLIASLATDGQDALTGVAGAIADVETCRRARERGIQPGAALRENDSLSVFESAGGLVETGPTGTNVNDIYIAYRARHPSG